MRAIHQLFILAICLAGCSVEQSYFVDDRQLDALRTVDGKTHRALSVNQRPR